MALLRAQDALLVTFSEWSDLSYDQQLQWTITNMGEVGNQARTQAPMVIPAADPNVDPR